MKKKLTKIWGVGLTLVLATTMLLFPVPVSAQATINVPGDFETIQAAINDANPGDTVSVAEGVWGEDLVIPEGKENLELAGAEGATIKGVANVHKDLWALAVPNIEILADGVSIHGFTIEHPDYVVDHYASGIVLDALNVEIYDNAFVDVSAETTDELSHSITTYSLTAIEDADCSGLNIYDNTFTGSGAIGSEFIYINPHIGTGSIAIDNNQFSGSVFIGATVESGNVAFTNNTVSNETEGSGLYGIRFMATVLNSHYSDIVVSGNEITGCGKAIRVGNGLNPSTSEFYATIASNTLIGNGVGIWARNGNRITAVDNTIVDNDVGILDGNRDTVVVTINALHNWWGQASGISGNDILAEEGVGGDGVDYEPWLLAEGGTHYEYTRPLPIGWSIISPDAELGSWGTGGTELMCAYDGGGFVTSFTLDPITPMFVKTETGGGIGFNYAEFSQGIFTTDLEAGWNLIGIPLISEEVDAEAILSPIRLGANSEVALATLASQGNYNPSEESFYESMLDLKCSVPDLHPFDGYWAYMNVAKEFGVVVID